MFRPLFLSLLMIAASVGCTSSVRTRTKPYVIAQNSAWEYLNLYGKEKNVSGFSDDLLIEIGNVENIKIQVMTTDKSPIVSLLNQDDIDAVLSALTPNDQNMRRYDFSDPYFELGPVLVVRENDQARSLEDMKNRDVGFERGYFFALQLASTADAIFDPYNDITYGFEDLKKGHIDGVIVDSMVAFRLVSGDYKGILRIAGPPLAPLSIRLIVKKGKNDELIHHFNQGLKALRENGLYLKMLRYWALFDATDPTSAYLTSPSEY